MSKAETPYAVTGGDSRTSDDSAGIGRGRGERKSLGDRIKEAEDNLRRLVEQQRKQTRAEREKFYRDLLEHLKAEKVEEFSLDTWKSATPAIRAALAKVSAKS